MKSRFSRTCGEAAIAEGVCAESAIVPVLPSASSISSRTYGVNLNSTTSNKDFPDDPLTKPSAWARVVSEKMTEWNIDQKYHEPVTKIVDHGFPLAMILFIGLIIHLTAPKK